MRKSLDTAQQPPAPPPMPAAAPQVTQTVTTKTTSPVNLFSPQPAAASSRRSDKPHVNEWFASLEPAYRLNHCAFYLYRLDQNIAVVEPNLEGRASGSMLDKLTPEVVGQLNGDNFLADLQVWTKGKYGGGNYHVQINDNKMHRMMYDIGFKIEGQPILSSREAYTSGAPLSAGGDSTMAGMVIKLIDDKLAGINAGRQNPIDAINQVTSVILDSQSKTFQWLLEQTKTGKPEDRLAEFRNMLGLMRELNPPAPAATAPPPQKSLVEQLQEFNLLQETLRKVKGENAPGENQPTMAATIAEAIAKAGGGRGRGTDYTWLVELGKAALPVVAPLVIALTEKIKAAPASGAPAAQRRIIGAPGTAQPAQDFRVPPGGGAVPAGGGIPSGGAAGGPMPGQAHAVHPGGNGAQPVPTPPPQPVEQPRDLTSDDVNMVVQHIISTRLVDMLLHDRTGEDAAASIQDMFPEAAVRMRFATVDMLRAVVSSDPILSHVKDDPRLTPFLQSFYDFFHPADDGEEDNPKVQ